MPRSRLILCFAMAAIAMAATAAGQAQAHAQAASPTISSALTVDLKTVWTVGGIVLPATWWLSWRFTKIADNLENIIKQVASIFGQLAEGSKRFAELDKRVALLEAKKK